MIMRARTVESSNSKGRHGRSARAIVGATMAWLLPVNVHAQQTLIDDFSTSQATLIVNPGPGTQISAVASGTSIGGGRVLRVSASAGGIMSGGVSEGLYAFSREAGPAGTSEMWWDGDSDTNFNLGLGADFTTDGQNQFVITVFASSSAALQMRLTAYTTGSDVSQADFTLPDGGVVQVPFTHFVATSGAGADFSNVNNLFLSVVNVPGEWTAAVDQIRVEREMAIFSDGFE